MKILLSCAGGMSTSLLVTKMQKEAEAKDMDINISAISINEIKDHLDSTDIILLGPQIRYKLKEVQNLIGDRNIKVEVIDPTDYGMAKGKNVLQRALEL